MGGQMLFSEIQEFVSEVISETDIENLKNILTKYIKPLGFDMHTCISVVNPENAPPSSLKILEFPERWIERYLNKNYCNEDVIFKKAMRDMRAFRWSDVKRVDRKAQKIFSESCEFGISNGVTVPIFLPGFYPVTINIVGDNLDISDDNYHAIHLMAVYYYNAIIRIQKSENNESSENFDLTSREKDCLRWVAQGKSEIDISDILSLSHHTVHTHIERAKKKLNVRTRTQAAVVAVQCGLILP